MCETEHYQIKTSNQNPESKLPSRLFTCTDGNNYHIVTFQVLSTCGLAPIQNQKMPGLLKKLFKKGFFTTKNAFQRR